MPRSREISTSSMVLVFCSVLSGSESTSDGEVRGATYSVPNATRCCSTSERRKRLLTGGRYGPEQYAPLNRINDVVSGRR